MKYTREFLAGDTVGIIAASPFSKAVWIASSVGMRKFMRRIINCRPLFRNHWGTRVVTNKYPPALETVAELPGLSSPCTMKGGKGMLTAFGLGFTSHIQ